MKNLRKNGGFTLIEMVVCIAIASLVTMAATTVLMLALRVNRQTADTASQQNTVRALLTTMEKAATGGNISNVKSDLESWVLYGENEEQEIFAFHSAKQTISANGIVVLEGVYASNAILENGLLSISIETKEGIFESTVYCRVGMELGEGESSKPTVPTDLQPSINKFLTILISQLNSDGKINYDSLKTALSKPGATYVPKSEATYYSEWYIGQTYENGVGQEGWNADTPWCACYVSWALVEAGMPAPKFDCDNTKHNHENWFADVDEFLDYLKQTNRWQERPENGNTAPDPGDLVFFDWITDDNVKDPQHVGVVLQVGTDYIITIEGNSAGRVAMRRYAKDDSRILGYGVLSGLSTE